ncbi:MAG: hypothetical protein JJU36_02445 [Phycisphaeraceae bacterium]|nr:hypothetical protein [Phycisphaeraceae bacterium]
MSDQAPPAQPGPRIIESTSFLEFEGSYPKVDGEHFVAVLRLASIAIPGVEEPVTASMTVTRRAGNTPEVTVNVPGLQRARAQADGSKLKLGDSKLEGPMTITVTFSRPRRGEEAPPPQSVDLHLDAQLHKVRDGDLPELDDAADWAGALLTAAAEPQGTAYLATGNWRRVGREADADEPSRGDLAARINPTIRPGHWNIGISNGGLELTLDMGTRRQNWNHFRASVFESEQVRDISAFHGLRIRIDTDEPREDAHVSVWLREEDGSWYYIKSAIPLIDPTNHATLLFEDFAEAEWVAPGNHMDEDYVLDLTTISHLAIGVVNPLGVGKVSFNVRQIDLVKIDREPAPPAQLRVTGRMISINDHDKIPAGVFGGYAPYLAREFRPGTQRNLGGPVMLRSPPEGGTEAYMIDCWFDRYASAVLLNNHRWAESLASWGRTYAQNALDQGVPAHLEFWNEPYLNWANHSARNFQVNFFDVDSAEEGGPVQVRYRVQETDEDGNRIRGQFRHELGPVIPHFRWRRDGDQWRVEDETQFTYWSGRGNGWIYDQMLAALGPAVKEVNPDVQIIAGWDFRWNEDHWAAWDMLYKPTIDRNIDWIDGIAEHHYQGDTTAMPGTYEVLLAYTVTKHDRWIYAYNTETGDLIDAPARGVVDTPEIARAATQYRRAQYELRDIIYAIAQTPDKFRARTIIHSGGRDGPTQFARVAYGMMKNLRGRMVEAHSDDPRVWVVASIDGTDPDAMPPGEPDRRDMVIMVFNDHRTPREFSIELSPPSGMTFAGTARIENNTVDRQTFQIGIDQREIRVSSDSASLDVQLEERSAWKITLPLKGTVPPEPQVHHRQHFSPTILKPIQRGRPVDFQVELPSERNTAARAWLRIVVEDVHEGEASVLVNGHEVPLPKALTADNVTRILELPVDLSWLRARNTLRFQVNPGNHAGYRVNMASIVLEHGQP